MGFLEYIRSKDRSTKAHLSLIGALVFTFLIAMAWMSTFSARMTPVSLNSREIENAEEKYDDTPRLGDIFGDVKTQLGALMGAKAEITTALSELETVGGEEGAVVAPIADDSALGTLGDPSVTASSTTDVLMRMGEEVLGTQGTTTPLTPPPPSTQEGVGVVTPPPAVEEEKPVVPTEPRVILIGTTTRQTVE